MVRLLLCNRLASASNRTLIVFRLIALSLISSALAGCAATLNYTDQLGPHYAGPGESRPDPEAEIRVATFNVEHSERIEQAIDLLAGHSELRTADIILLQEMDAAGTQSVAEALGLYWVYFPASVSRQHKRDFGNAILSRWPISEERKVILPRLAYFIRSQRIAVFGSVEIEGRKVQLCSTHLALPLAAGLGARGDQVERILSEVKESPHPLIIGGDMNGGGIGKAFERAGFSWPTRGLGATTKIFGVDHLFTSGFDFAQKPPAGVVRDNLGSSDHRPVWSVLRFAEQLPRSRKELPLARRDESLGIDNAAWIDSTLLRGARPNDVELDALKAAGFRTIVNFTTDPAERARSAKLGLDYFEIPLTAHLWSSPPTEAQVQQFLELTADPDRRPLFFHCAQGKDRTGMMAAVYRVEFDRWTNGEAIHEMQTFGYHDWFKDLIQYARTYVPSRTVGVSLHGYQTGSSSSNSTPR